MISSQLSLNVLIFELQSSRLVHPNRNDEPDPMAATRASGEGSEIELFFAKYTENNKKSGGVRGAGPPRMRLDSSPVHTSLVETLRNDLCVQLQKHGSLY